MRLEWTEATDGFHEAGIAVGSGANLSSWIVQKEHYGMTRWWATIVFSLGPTQALGLSSPREMEVEIPFKELNEAKDGVQKVFDTWIEQFGQLVEAYRKVN